jgi:hypothetical protein
MKDGEGKKENMTTWNDIYIFMGEPYLEGYLVSQDPGRKVIAVVEMEGDRDKGV